MLSCKDASVMVSQSLDKKLTLRERLGLQLHLVMCKACRSMANQMHVLRAVARRYRTIAGESVAEQPALSGEARERIRARLQHAARRSDDQEP